MIKRARDLKYMMVVAALLILKSGGTEAAGNGPYRFQSPSGRFDIIVQPLTDDWTHAKDIQTVSANKESKKQYGLDLYPAKSTEPVNSMVYSDVAPPPAPEEIVKSMLWSANEEFVALPDRQKAGEQTHILVASLSTNKLWSLQADHVQWIDNHRFVGDLKTKELPGAIIQFDGALHKAEVLIQPDSGIGYQIAALSGRQLTVKQILNDRGTGRTTWESFTPACFNVDLDSLKKRSVPCPASPALQTRGPGL